MTGEQPDPPITKFDGSHAFLSNFHPSPITDLNGNVWPTVEHAFQGAKTTDPAERERIRAAPTPGRAKRLGRQCKLRANWDAIKDELMVKLVRAKFTEHADLLVSLLATGDAELVEGNTWGDRYWGVDEKGTGRNQLGLTLMAVRETLRELTLGPADEADSDADAPRRVLDLLASRNASIAEAGPPDEPVTNGDLTFGPMRVLHGNQGYYVGREMTHPQGNPLINSVETGYTPHRAVAETALIHLRSEHRKRPLPVEDDSGPSP